MHILRRGHKIIQLKKTHHWLEIVETRVDPIDKRPQEKITSSGDAWGLASVLPFIMILSAILDYCPLPHIVAIKMVNITISKNNHFPPIYKGYIGNMRMPSFAENDFVYNVQWDLVNKAVIDFIPEMILNTTLNSSAARLGHQDLLSKPRKVNVFKWFTETPWSVVASEEDIHLSQGCKILKPAHASSWHTASMLVSLSAKALPSI